MTSLTCRLLLCTRCIPSTLLHLHNNSNLQYVVTSFTISQRHLAGYKLQDNLRDCYSLLNVSEGCTKEELKEAYLNMAKMYHPDSALPSADARKFHQVKEAYKIIKRRLEEKESLGQYFEEDDDDDDFFGIRPLRAQHRQYLDNEGVGFGSRGQRQKQYEQLRVSKAQRNVLQYKIQRIMPEGDNALVAKDQKAAKKTKMSNTVDRLVEDMIQESMSKGHFDNLPGAGKPLDFSKDNPFMDRTTQKLNQILLDEDLLPDWISRQKEIRSDLQKCREKLASDMQRLKDFSHSIDYEKRKTVIAETFKTSLGDINTKIFNFNLIVPILDKQMMPYSYEKEYNKVCEDIGKYLPNDYGSQTFASQNYQYMKAEKISMKDIWAGLKDIFKMMKKT